MKKLMVFRIVFLVLIIVGAAFRILHFPGGFTMMLVGVLGFLIVMIVQLMGKKK